MDTHPGNGSSPQGFSLTENEGGEGGHMDTHPGMSPHPKASL